MKELLEELLPRKVRLWIYLLVMLAMVVLMAWQASDGDWRVFAVALAGALQSALSISKLNPDPPALTGATDTALYDEAVDRGKTVVDLKHYQWLRGQALEAPESSTSVPPDYAGEGTETPDGR